MSRRSGRLHLAITTLLALTVAGLTTGVIPAGANHQFPDVATANAFHDSIDNFVNAGCATGFPDGTYHPTDAVNRQQIARFINACGGRVSEADSVASTTLGVTALELASVSIEGGALGEGAGFVFTIATYEMTSGSSSGFPCETVVILAGGGDQENALVDLPLDTADQFEHAHATLTTLSVVEAGQTLTTALTSRVDNAPACGATITGEATVTSMYFPFAGDGSGGGE